MGPVVVGFNKKSSEQLSNLEKMRKVENQPNRINEPMRKANEGDLL